MKPADGGSTGGNESAGAGKIFYDFLRLALPKEITDLDHKERGDLRNLLSAQFARGRESAPLASHNEAYARVRGLMASEKLFDISGESDQVRDLYGRTLFGEPPNSAPGGRARGRA